MDILGSMKQELLMDSPGGLTGVSSSLWTSSVATPPAVVQSRPVVSHLRKDLAQHELKATSDSDPFKMLSMFYQQQQACTKSGAKGNKDLVGTDTAIMGSSSSLSRIRAKKKRGRMMMQEKLNSKKAESETMQSTNLPLPQSRTTVGAVCFPPRETTTSIGQPHSKTTISVNLPQTMPEVTIINETKATSPVAATTSGKVLEDIEIVDSTAAESVSLELSVDQSVESEKTSVPEQKPVRTGKRGRPRKQAKTTKTKPRKKAKVANDPESNNVENEDDETNIHDVPSDENDESFLLDKNENSENKDSGPTVIKRRPKKTPEELEALKNKDRPFLCKFCGKTYLTKKNLRYHEACHSEDRKYICDYPGCGKGFKLNAHLKTHKYMHGEENKFVCSYDGCDKAYRSPDTLRLHEHIHQPGLYVCEFAGCGKSFPVKRRLNRHIIRSHRDNRKFPCTYKGCDRVCTSRSNLKEHMEGHIEDRERFTCKICNKGMMSEHTLKRHIKQVHCAERNFMCSICGKRYKTKSNLAQHVNIHLKNAMRDNKTDGSNKDTDNMVDSWTETQTDCKDYYYDDYPVQYT